MSFLDFVAVIAGNAIGVLLVHWIGTLTRRARRDSAANPRASSIHQPRSMKP